MVKGLPICMQPLPSTAGCSLQTDGVGKGGNGSNPRTSLL